VLLLLLLLLLLINVIVVVVVASNEETDFNEAAVTENKPKLAKSVSKSQAKGCMNLFLSLPYTQ
jgi:uncharacterized protein (UPF0333 family)